MCEISYNSQHQLFDHGKNSTSFKQHGKVQDTNKIIKLETTGSVIISVSTPRPHKWRYNGTITTPPFQVL